MIPSPNPTFVPARRLGPQGGNLDNPEQHPHFREAEFQEQPQPDGSLGLHRPQYRNSAVAGLKNEQPWHRMAAFMLLAGRTNSEIAMSAGVIPQTVSNLRTQLWFQQLLATLANEQGEAVVGLIQSEAIASVQRIIEIRDSPNVKANVALAAANILLEQANGKAVQKVVSEVSHRNFSDPASELASIQSDLDSIRRARVACSIPVAASLLPPPSKDGDPASPALSDVSRPDSHATE